MLLSRLMTTVEDCVPMRGHGGPEPAAQPQTPLSHVLRLPALTYVSLGEPVYAQYTHTLSGLSIGLMNFTNVIICRDGKVSQS